MQHQAWLDATPEDKSTKAGKAKSRREQMEGSAFAEIEPEGECRWLVSAAIDCGLTQSNGMGLGPVSWAEIQAWAAVTGEDDMWVLHAVRQLSIAYVGEHYAAKDGARPSPMADYIDPALIRAGVSSQLKRLKIAGTQHGR